MFQEGRIIAMRPASRPAAVLTGRACHSSGSGVATKTLTGLPACRRLCDPVVDARAGLLALMPVAILIESRPETVQGQADIDDDVIDDEGIDAGSRRGLRLKPEGSFRVQRPVAEILESGFGENSPGRVLARRGRGVHLDRLAFGLGATPQASGESRLQKDVADMLVADAENLADFGAVVTRLRERADLVRLCRQSVCDITCRPACVHVVAHASQSLTILNAFSPRPCFIHYVINRIIMA
jgi:hypothetical protein